MSVQKLVGILITLTSTAVLADAKKPASQWNVSTRLSTLGVQGEIGYRFNETFGLRFQAGGFIHKRKTFDFAGVSYHDVEINPQTYNIIADWYFLDTYGFKLSIGGGYNRNKLILNRDMSALAEVPGTNGVPGSFVGIARASYHFSRFTPYFGMGYDSKNLFGSQFSLSCDVGAYFQGNGRATVSATGPIQNDANGMDKLKHSAEDVINDTWWIKTYPVVSVALRYHF